MSINSTTLVAREEIAAGTMAFHLQRPKDFEFKPGQALELILPVQTTTPDDPNTRHAFSIVAAPYQDDLVVATRMRDSAFKRALKALPIGSALTIDGPFGSLGLHNDLRRAALFIAGGIGITPIMSILRQAAQDQRPQRLVLLYSNRRPDDAAFLEELQGLEKKNPHFELVATMTDMKASQRPWSGQTGLVDAALIGRVTGELRAPIFYVVGPPGMVEAMRQTLNRAGVNDDDIRSEEFYGY